MYKYVSKTCKNATRIRLPGTAIIYYILEKKMKATGAIPTTRRRILLEMSEQSSSQDTM